MRSARWKPVPRRGGTVRGRLTAVLTTSGTVHAPARLKEAGLGGVEQRPEMGPAELAITVWAADPVAPAEPLRLVPDLIEEAHMTQPAVVRPRQPPRKGRSTGAPAPTAKREAQRMKSTAAAQAREVSGTAVGQSKLVARTASQDARELAGAAREQAQQVKGQLAEQARALFADSRSQLQEEADRQTGRLAQVICQAGNQAVALAAGRPEQAGALVDYAEQAANWLDTCATAIEERGLEGLSADVVDFARRRPGVFLAGAAVAGIAVGRLLRSGAVSAADDEETET